MDGVGDLKGRNVPKNQDKTAWWQPAIMMFLKLSVWITAPVIIAMYLGKWLDEKYQTEPWLFLSSIGIAFIISMIGLIRSTSRELKKFVKPDNLGKDRTGEPKN